MAGIAWKSPAGDFAEVGVYKGGSAKVLYEICQRKGGRLFLFDTFNGIPFKGEFDSHEVGQFGDCSYEEVRDFMPCATTVKGIFPASIQDMPKMSRMSHVAFVHADADQYQSTVDVCRVFGPLMVKGGMILFDDYRGVGGCIKAVDEYFPQREILPDNRALVTF